MTNEQIEVIVKKKKPEESIFQIRFKTRNPLTGLFIQMPDYQELSRKNLWRVVSENNIAEYKKTNNPNLARIFNGAGFTRLKP